jgi:hypothetical protein
MCSGDGIWNGFYRASVQAYPFSSLLDGLSSAAENPRVLTSWTFRHIIA